MQLIKISEHQNQQVVSARDLHCFLESKKDFSAWIEHRIKKYGLCENEDYMVFTQTGENSLGGRPANEYALTIDAAKELAMVEGNEKGKQARQYFIECEKKLKQVTHTPAEMLLHSAKLLVEQERRINNVEEKVKELEAKSETSPSGFYTIAGYASLKKLKFDIRMAADLGRKAARLCKELGYTTGVIPDPRFGTVKTYPQEVLSSVFTDYKTN